MLTLVYTQLRNNCDPVIVSHQARMQWTLSSCNGI
jgi:hypothetical protein